MSYASYSSAHYSPPSHASSLSSSFSSGSNYGSSGHSSVAARYEAAKSFDLEDDLEFCPSLTIDEVRQYYDDITAKTMFFPMYHQQLSPPSQSSTPSPPNTYIHPSPPHYSQARLAVGDSQQGPAFRPPSRNRGTAAIKIIDPSTREERRRYY